MRMPTGSSSPPAPTRPKAVRPHPLANLFHFKHHISSADIVELTIIAFWGEQRYSTLNIHADLKYVPISEILKYCGGKNALGSRQYNSHTYFGSIFGNLHLQSNLSVVAKLSYI